MLQRKNTVILNKTFKYTHNAQVLQINFIFVENTEYFQIFFFSKIEFNNENLFFLHVCENKRKNEQTNEKHRKKIYFFAN